MYLNVGINGGKQVCGVKETYMFYDITKDSERTRVVLRAVIFLLILCVLSYTRYGDQV